MTQSHITLFTNVGKTQIKETDTHFNIEGVPITVDNAVMNGLLYSAEDNKRGMPTIKDKVITLSHPTTQNGQGADAYAGESLQRFFSGGYIETVYSDSGTWKVNISVDKNMLKAQDKNQGTDFYSRLANKDDVGVSTGLYTEVEKVSGTNALGQKYTGKATKQTYNHLAFLEKAEPPAGGDATFMRFNSEGEHMVVNVDEFAGQEIAACEDKETNLVNKITESIRGLFADNQSKTEDKQMPDMKTMMEALKKANMYKDNMTNEMVESAYKKMMKEKNMDNEEHDDMPMKEKKDSMKGNAELLDVINKLSDKIESLESKLNAQEQKSRDELIEQINCEQLGLDKEDLADMQINTLQKLAAKSGVTVGLSAARGIETNADDAELFDDVN
jgi:hypothetical protein